MISTQPRLGDRVIYRSHVGDGVESPAMVLRTNDDTVREVLAKWEGAPEDLKFDLDDGEADLLVHGLARDYRVYAVPFSLDADPRTWRWQSG